MLGKLCHTTSSSLVRFSTPHSTFLYKSAAMKNENSVSEIHLMTFTQYLIQCLSSWQVEPDSTCKEADHGGDGVQKHGPESIFHDGNPLESKDEYEPGCCQSQGDETNVDRRYILDENTYDAECPRKRPHQGSYQIQKHGKPKHEHLR